MTTASLETTSFTLRNGASVQVREMQPADSGALLGFAGSLPVEDLLFLRTDISTPVGIKEWVTNLERGHTVTLLAFDAEHLVGYASVHRTPTQWTRRVGELRVTVSPKLRGHGLGRHLTSEILALAPRLGLRKITAQMTTDQPSARAVFEALGFAEEAVLHGWVEDRYGETRDLLVMVRDVDR